MESCNWAFVFPGLIRWQWTRTGGQGGLRPFISLGVGEGLRGRKAGPALPKSKQPSTAHPGHWLALPPLPLPHRAGPKADTRMVSTSYRSREGQGMGSTVLRGMQSLAPVKFIPERPTAGSRCQDPNLALLPGCLSVAGTVGTSLHWVLCLCLWSPRNGPQDRNGIKELS